MNYLVKCIVQSTAELPLRTNLNPSAIRELQCAWLPMCNRTVVHVRSLLVSERELEFTAELQLMAGAILDRWKFPITASQTGCFEKQYAITKYTIKNCVFGDCILFFKN